MAHATVLAGAILAAYLIYLTLQKRSTQSRYHKAARQHNCKPAPHYAHLDPILGLDLFLLILKADIAGHRSRLYARLHSVYGTTFTRKALGSTQIHTAQAENIRAICATQFSDFGVGPIRGDVGAPFFGRGVFTEDGEYWKHSRALIRPTFNRAEVADLVRFEGHVRRFLALIPRDSGTFDVQPLLKRLVRNFEYYVVVLIVELTHSLVPGYIYRVPLWPICRVAAAANGVRCCGVQQGIRSLLTRPGSKTYRGTIQASSCV